MLRRNRIKGSKATTYHNFEFGFNEETNILSISGGEYWQNGELMFEDVPLFDIDTNEPLLNETGVDIQLEVGKEYRIYLVQNGAEVYIADTIQNLDSPTTPLMLLACGNIDELFVNEVMK